MSHLGRRPLCVVLRSCCSPSGSRGDASEGSCWMSSAFMLGRLSTVRRVHAKRSADVKDPRAKERGQCRGLYYVRNEGPLSITAFNALAMTKPDARMWRE